MAGRINDLRIHTDPRGALWWTADGSPARIWRGTARDMVASAYVAQAARIRLLGTRDNTAMLVALLDTLDQRAAGTVRVGGPRVCPPGIPADRPAIILQQMKMGALPGSMGGWHVLTAREQPVYELIHALQRNDDKAASYWLGQHPAWPALSFVPRCSMWHAVRLVARIIDPRWYIDPRKPDARGALYRYLGLTEQYMRHALSSEYTQAHGATQRAKLVLDTWASCNSLPQGEHLFAPENFIWRRCQTSSNQVRALLRGCQRFVWFLRDVWLSNVTGRDLFVAKYFFDSAEEADSYEQHVAGLPPAFQQTR